MQNNITSNSIDGKQKQRSSTTTTNTTTTTATATATTTNPTSLTLNTKTSPTTITNTHPITTTRRDHYSSKRILSTANVTHFDFTSLVDQNNLSDDSCLIVVDHKVYDLTLWIQPHLSCNQSTVNSYDGRLASSHPSPPPSPVVNSSLHNRSAQFNQFDMILSLAKTDPVRAGDLLRFIYDQGLRGSDRIKLEDRIQDCRIGDFTPQYPINSGSSPFYQQPFPPPSQNTPFNNLAQPYTHYNNVTAHSGLSRIHPQSNSSDLRQSHRNSPLTSNFIPQAPSTCFNPSDSPGKNRFVECGAELNLRLGAGSSRSARSHMAIQGSSSSSMRQPPTGRPCHLDRATALVGRLKQQVADAQRGVGIANLSLSEAWDQLAKAEMIKDHLIIQSSEGFRPVWPEWEEEFQ